MSGRTIQTLVQSWETVRCELLNTRIPDLRLHIEGSPVEPYVQRLYRELEAKKIRFRPKVYLTDGWGCPDRTPVIGVPFYLADRRLTTLEEEQSGDIEDARSIMMLLRHEAGHSVNYAYRLWRRPSWVEIFGPFSRPYRDVFRPDRMSRHYVRHISAHPYGRTYAQKHPDEDFAETFGVWLTPPANWKKAYRNRAKALSKLHLVGELVAQYGKKNPEVPPDPRNVDAPLRSIEATVAEVLGAPLAPYRKKATGYVDPLLKRIGSYCPKPSDPGLILLADVIGAHRGFIIRSLARNTRVTLTQASYLVAKLLARSRALRLYVPLSKLDPKLIDIVCLASSLATRYAVNRSLS